MKYSTAFIPAFAVASLAASIETRQSKLPSSVPSAAKKLPWTEAPISTACGPWGVDEYTCGTEKFCQMLDHPRMEACQNPQGWKTAQECLDGHEAKPSRDQCSKQRQATYDQCQKDRQEKPEAEKPEIQECITRGQEVFESCLGFQKFKTSKERLEEFRAKGCTGI
ncbi:hypothetical protein G3M48_006052 [Beauveria asiatica]|uniref:Uncharacterized protein n=1 Tax=Beauveria asiatica TaxID=1069075 RepID=A0AAW0RQG3_9HYPO